jgi:orotate phosphoribosyltransferase
VNETPSDQRTQLVDLIKKRSLKLGSFTLSSGRESSFYIDARRTTMSAHGLKLIGQLGLSAIRDAGWSAGFVGGLTLGADPVAYAVALASIERPPLLDAFTVRKEPKSHGTEQRIEGCFGHSASVIVAEDVITTGGSALNAIAAVEAAGAQVAGVLAVVDREEGGRDAIENGGYSVRVLVTLSDLGLDLQS